MLTNQIMEMKRDIRCESFQDAEAKINEILKHKCKQPKSSTSNTDMPIKNSPGKHCECLSTSS